MLCNYGLGFAEHVCPCPLAVSRCSETMGSGFVVDISFVSQPTDHPRTSLSLGKVDAPSTKLSFKMEGASFLHFLNTPLWQSPLTLAPAGSLSRDLIEEAQRELFVSPACCQLRRADSLSRR